MLFSFVGQKRNLDDHPENNYIHHHSWKAECLSSTAPIQGPAQDIDSLLRPILLHAHHGRYQIMRQFDQQHHIHQSGEPAGNQSADHPENETLIGQMMAILPLHGNNFHSFGV